MPNLQAEYQARILATQSNLRRYYNEALGLIFAGEDKKMSEEDALTALDALDEQWAKILVDDLAPEEHIIVTTTEIRNA